MISYALTAHVLLYVCVCLQLQSDDLILQEGRRGQAASLPPLSRGCGVEVKGTAGRPAPAPMHKCCLSPRCCFVSPGKTPK